MQKRNYKKEKLKLRIKIRFFFDSSIEHIQTENDLTSLCKHEEMLLEYKNYLNWSNCKYKRFSRNIYEQCKNEVPIRSYMMYAPLDMIINDYYNNKINVRDIYLCSSRNDLTVAFTYTFRRYLVLRMSLKKSRASIYLLDALEKDYDMLKWEPNFIADIKRQYNKIRS